MDTAPLMTTTTGAEAACPRCEPDAGGEQAVRLGTPRIALVGNPNTGKTTLFNRLSGLRHKTSNFPGTTLEARLGRVRLPAGAASGGADGQEDDAALIDL